MSTLQRQEKVQLPLHAHVELPQQTRTQLYDALAAHGAIPAIRTKILDTIIQTQYDLRMQERFLELLRESKGKINREAAFQRMIEEAEKNENRMGVPGEVAKMSAPLVLQKLRDVSTVLDR